MSIDYDTQVVLGKIGNLRDAINTLEKVNQKVELDAIEPWIAEDLRVLHLQRGIQAITDLANHLIAENDWKAPEAATDSVLELGERGVLSDEIANTAMRMIGFRNIAVHEYGELDSEVVRFLAETRLEDLETVGQMILNHTIEADD